MVGKGEAEAYRRAGAAAVEEGGGLCASRNLALRLARAAGRHCVQVSDDIRGDVAFYHDAEPRAPAKTSEALRAAKERAAACV